MPSFMYKIILLLLCTLLQACQPEFARDQTEHYARNIGVINQFQISRWHNRLILANVNIAVISENIDQLDAGALSHVIANGLAPYFQRVDGGNISDNLNVARIKAKELSADYLLFIECNDQRSVFNQDSPGADNNYLSLRLTFNVVDVVSGQLIDKITLSAKSSVFKLLGDDMQAMLAKPLRHIGRDLTGSR